MADSRISLASGLPKLMLRKQLNTYVTSWRAQVREKGVGWGASSVWSNVLNKGLFSEKLALTSTKAIWQKTSLLSHLSLYWLWWLLFALLLNSEEDVSAPEGTCFTRLAYPPFQLSPRKSYFGQFVEQSSPLERWMLSVMDFENHSIS